MRTLARGVSGVGRADNGSMIRLIQKCREGSAAGLPCFSHFGKHLPGCQGTDKHDGVRCMILSITQGKHVTTPRLVQHGRIRLARNPHTSLSVLKHWTSARWITVQLTTAVGLLNNSGTGFLGPCDRAKTTSRGTANLEAECS